MNWIKVESGGTVVAKPNTLQHVNTISVSSNKSQN